MYDVAVIGAGPGGYVAAIRCAQLGLRTICIDDREKDGKAALGGTCLNVGCIPSKALLESSEHFEKAKLDFALHGISTGEMSIDLAVMQKRKQQIVDAHTSGIAFLFRKNGVESMLGRARIASAGESCSIEVSGKRIETAHVIIATGSSPRTIEGIPFGEKIVDSTGALAFRAIPEKLGIVGAGVIGLELGSIWRRLGSDVTLFDALPDFLPLADQSISKEALRIFRKQSGWRIRLGTRLISAEEHEDGVAVKFEENGKAVEEKFERLIVAVGRTPNSQDIAHPSLNLDIDERGFIAVDERCKTSLKNVYAIGDVAGGAMLAHKASEEGVMVAESIAGSKPVHDASLVPNVIYTDPEIAWVGKTESQLRKEGIEYRIGQFPFSANGRARVIGSAQGFVKMLAEADTDRLLGVHIIGPQASELISEAVLSLAFSASSEDIGCTIHAHPTLSEALREAALAVTARALHI